MLVELRNNDIGTGTQNLPEIIKCLYSILTYISERVKQDIWRYSQRLDVSAR